MAARDEDVRGASTWSCWSWCSRCPASTQRGPAFGRQGMGRRSHRRRQWLKLMYMAAHMYNDFLRIEVKHCICILYGEVISVFCMKATCPTRRIASSGWWYRGPWLSCRDGAARQHPVTNCRTRDRPLAATRSGHRVGVSHAPRHRARRKESYRSVSDCVACGWNCPRLDWVGLGTVGPHAPYWAV
jgi:hypothetical protein